MSDRQKLFYALLVSALFHLLLALVLGIWTAQHAPEVARALPDLSRLTVTIMPARPRREPVVPVAAPRPKSTAVATPPPARPVRPLPTPELPALVSDGLTKAEKAPTHAAFQADSNMAAGSELPANGNLPLPAIAGPQRHFIDFAERAASVGSGQDETQKGPLAKPADRSSATVNPAMPLQTPSAITQVLPSRQPERPVPIQPTPQPTPVPKPTPARDELALGTPTPTPQPTPAAEMAKLIPPPPLRVNPDVVPVARPAAQPRRTNNPAPLAEMTKTRVEGRINRPGRPGVDAVGTPYGRYFRVLWNLVGSRYRLYVQEHSNDIGDVVIHFRVNTAGRVIDARIVENHSTDNLGEIAISAIRDSKLPPVPNELAPMLRDGMLEFDFPFSVYDSHNDNSGR